MRGSRHVPTVAERARQIANLIDQIGAAARGDQPAALKLGVDRAFEIQDTIGRCMLYVHDWVTRRLGIETANALRNEVDGILSAMEEPQMRTTSGALILDLFGAATILVFKLRNWAEDIEFEEKGRRGWIRDKDPTHRTNQQLNETARRILASCRRRSRKGERIANDLGLSYDYTRRVLAGLVREGLLRNDDRGYRTLKRGA